MVVVENADQFYKAFEVGAITDGEGRIVQAGVKKVAVFRLGDEYHTIQNYCPHAGGFLGLGTVKNDCVRCPRHGWKFDIRTGECITNPRYEVRRYVTKIEDGWVWVGVPDDGNMI